MTARRRWAWVLVLVVGVVLFEAVRRTLVDTQNPNLLPSLILLGAAVIPAAFVTFLAGRRVPVGVSGGLLAIVALVGGVIGVVAAGSLEFSAMRRIGPTSVLAVGLIEEAVKLIVPVLMLLLARRRWRLADGLLVGVASGAGFAALETMGYAFVTLITSRGDLAAVDGVLMVRGLLSPAAHMAWTGLSAAALWRARLAPPAQRGRALAAFVGVYLLVVVLHTLWDAVGAVWMYGVLAAISLGLLLRTTHQLHVRAEPPQRAPAPVAGGRGL